MSDAVAEWLPVFVLDATFSGVSGVERSFGGDWLGNFRRLLNEFALPSSAIDFFVITGRSEMLLALLLLLFTKFAKLALFLAWRPLSSDRSSSSNCEI